MFVEEMQKLENRKNNIFRVKELELKLNTRTETNTLEETKCITQLL